MRNSRIEPNRALSIAVMATCVSLVNTFVLFAASAADNDEVKSDKHIHIPFIHVDVEHHGDGTRDVQVKAPFAHVDKPAGVNNARVKAPWTKVTDNGPTANTTKAPFTKVVRHNDGTTSTKAPFTEVDRH